MTERNEPANARKFRELAEKRVVKAMKAIRLVGNLSNRTNYSYTEEEAKKIVSALQKEVWAVKRRFKDSGNPDEVEFTL